MPNVTITSFASRRIVVLFSALVAISFAPLTANSQTPEAQARFEFVEGGSFDSAIPSPESFLGYEAGDRFTLYAHVAQYLTRLAESSDRISMVEYGRTYEGRPLYYLVVTTPENHSRLEEIRQANVAMATVDAAPPAPDQPIIVWMSYNVHGNEASSTEAAMRVAYELAASQADDVQSLLTNSVVILDPCINPDGRDRYVGWYNSVQSNQLATNANDLEHREPWPGGRTNHYWFDLNRDWVWLVHPESQGRIAAYQEWLPQAHLDFHEQGFDQNYFTMPGTTPRNLNLPPEMDKWADVFGRGVIKEFDRHGITYSTREAFDFFYPGYGSSYPSIMGGIGMLAEQGGHSRGGRAVETQDGFVLTLRQRIFDHYTNSFATIRTAVENRAGLQEYFRSFFAAPDRQELRTYVLSDDGGHGFSYDVVNLLMKHGVEVGRADSDFSISSAWSYRDGDVARRQFQAGSFVVRSNQARHILVNTLLQPDMAIEDSVTYDMSTWSAPMAYNVEAYWSAGDASVGTTPVTESLGHTKGVDNADAQYAYVIEWSQRNAPKALSALWRAGYAVRSAGKSFATDDKSFGRGSLIVLLGRNQDLTDKAAADMRDIAERTGVEIVGLNTGRMKEGIDLASRDSNPLKKSRAALLVGDSFSSYSAGQIWHLFDRDSDFGINRIGVNQLRASTLRDIDVLVFPSGNISSALDSSDIATVRQWVRQGGTLVATEGTSMYFTKANKFGSVERLKSLAELEASDKKSDKDKAAEKKLGGEHNEFYTRYEDREDSTGLRRIPGSALRGIIDDSHPLAFGTSDLLFSLKQSTNALKPSSGLQTVGYYHPEPSSLLASGYASQKNLKRLAGASFAGVATMGEGKIVYLVDNTQYRMFWRGTSRLIQNAVMIMPSY